MKTSKLLFLLMALFLAIVPVFALGQQLEPNEPGGLIAWLSPIIIWVVGQLVKLFKNVPGWVMLSIVVPLLSFASAWALEKLQLTDLNFWLQFVYGLLAVFVDQLKKKIQEAAAPATL